MINNCLTDQGSKKKTPVATGTSAGETSHFGITLVIY